MIHLIYVSSATREISQGDLLMLLEQSRLRNKRQDITGMLLYARNSFFQVLEGEEKDVDEIYASITNDERNNGNIVIEKKPINERTFPNWSMGFRRLTNQDKTTIKGLSEFIDGHMHPEEFANTSNMVTNLLYQFKAVNA